MKKITLVFAFMLAVAGAAAQSMYVHKTDGNVYEFKVSDVDSINFAASTTDDYFYTVTYMPNGGEGDVVVDTIRYGVSYTFRNYSTTFTRPSYAFHKWNTRENGSGAYFTVGDSVPMVVRDIKLYAIWYESSGMENGYEWVDLGLPSGLKWATSNAGSVSKSNYYDVASSEMGGTWRTPTYREFGEFNRNCTSTWINDYNGTGINGRIFTSKLNGMSIFFPADGYYNSGYKKGTNEGYYWTADASYYFYFSSSSPSVSSSYGIANGDVFSVRGVCE